MDLQRGERVLKVLEQEAGKIASIAALRHDLGSLQQKLASSIGVVAPLVEELKRAEETLRELDVFLRQGLERIRAEGHTQTRDFQQIWEMKIGHATTQYEGLLRSETRSLAERMEMNHKGLLQDVTNKLGAIAEQQVRNFADHQKQQRNALALVSVLFIVVTGAVVAATYWVFRM